MAEIPLKSAGRPAAKTGMPTKNELRNAAYYASDLRQAEDWIRAAACALTGVPEEFWSVEPKRLLADADRMAMGRRALCVRYGLEFTDLTEEG